jgi:hypothetical protein
MFKRSNEQSIIYKYSSSSTYLDSTKGRFSSTMNFLHFKSGIFFEPLIVNTFTSIIEEERRKIGEKTMLRMHFNQIDQGMYFAEDCITRYGIVIGYKGDLITEESVQLIKESALGYEIPQKLLIMK